MKYYKTLKEEQHKELYEFIFEHHDEIVLDMFEVVRLE